MSAAEQYRVIRPSPRPVDVPVLDAAQRSVVEHQGGPLLVLAGPGTGKTTTLVEAVVARVNAGVPVDDMLMLTFSRRAAGEMRERVTARLNATVREPIARTLHSYAFGVLRMAAVAQDLPAPRLLSGPEQDVTIRRLLAGSPPARWPQTLRPALGTQAFAAELRALMMRAVERGLDGPSLVDLGRGRGRPDWVAAGQFLDEYQQVTALAHPSGYDPAELIRSALNVLRDDPALLAAERQRRRRIFVDEYQDTDPAQERLLAVLTAGGGRTSWWSVTPISRSTHSVGRTNRRSVTSTRASAAGPRSLSWRCRRAADPARCCWPRRAGWPSGCLDAPSSGGWWPPTGCPLGGSRSGCSGRPARRPPSSRARFAGPIWRASRGRGWPCWCDRPPRYWGRCGAR